MQEPRLLEINLKILNKFNLKVILSNRNSNNNKNKLKINKDRKRN
jgi:hypothetical protein